MPETEQLSALLKSQGEALGFNLVGIAPAVSPSGFHPLLEWIGNGYHADMDWIPRRETAYQHPNGVLPNTRSVIVVALNYNSQPPAPDAARIARYAWGAEDYHSVMRRKLKQVTQTLHQHQPNDRTRVVIDTAPLLERDFAQLAGIGWRGKNTMLISREIGSWFFLGAILTTAQLDYDTPFETDHCGTCTRCLDACPTDAFPKAHVLDANKCISYLTIERRDKPVPDELKQGVGDWIFGCDICQEVCPWNRFAPNDCVPEFQPVPHLHNLQIGDLLSLTDSQFKVQFANTPLERTGRDVIVRNAAIVAGNQGDSAHLPLLQKLQTDSSSLVRDAANWAIFAIK